MFRVDTPTEVRVFRTKIEIEEFLWHECDMDELEIGLLTTNLPPKVGEMNHYNGVCIERVES